MDGRERDRAELEAEIAALREREETYRTLVEGTNDTLYSATPEGQLTYLGLQFASYGFDPEQVMRDGMLSVILPEDHERVLADLQRMMETGEEFPTSFRVRTPDGRVVWLEDHGKLRRDAEGAVIGLWGVLRDITRRKETEQALRRSEERFRSLAERSFDAVFELDVDGRFSFISPSIERITGRTTADYLGRHFDHFVQQTDREHAAAARQSLLRGDALEGYQFEVIRTDGTRGTIEINVAAVLRDDGGVEFHGILRDITARLALETQVRQMQKMEAIGTLAGGVAHDFNNLLTGILGYANLIKGLAPPEDQVFKAAAVIESAAERAAELTQQLLGFARRGKLQNRPVDLHRLVREVTALLARTTDRRIVISQRLEADPPLVRGDPGQLQQVLLNLAVNARDAMPLGGDLTITTVVQELDARFCAAHPDLEPGRHLVVTVSDTGIGMSAEVRSRIFEPFFTTKDRGQGTGMGLATVYGIVKNHQGVLEVTSTPGEGTSFRVLLPQPERLEAPRRPRQAAAGAAGSGHVLVVDDEEVVHQVARGMLEPLGYEVSGVYDGQQALDYYRKHGDRVDLVLLDLTMPVLDGRDCFRRLRDLDPTVRVVLSTGHGLDGAAQRLLDEGVAGFIQKPYMQAQLAAAIEQALAK